VKITVNTFGTRGDIQPYIALGLGLQQAGHSIRIVTHQIFESFVKERGLDCYPVGFKNLILRILLKKSGDSLYGFVLPTCLIRRTFGSLDRDFVR